MFTPLNDSLSAFYGALWATPVLWGLTLVGATPPTLAQSLLTPTETTLVATPAMGIQGTQPADLQPEFPLEHHATRAGSVVSPQAALVGPGLWSTSFRAKPAPHLNPEFTYGEKPLSSHRLGLSPLQTPAASMAQIIQNTHHRAADDTAGPNRDADAPALLAPSTDSGDRQSVGSPLTSEDFVQDPVVQSNDMAQTPPQSQPEQWHFLLQPYIYLPVSLNGSANFSNISSDFDFGVSEIGATLQRDLDFVFFGELEGWTPDYKWGFLVNGDYLSLSNDRDRSFTLPVRFPGLAGTVPAELDVSVNTDIWRVDLAATYRFYDPAKVNPDGISTEFDLGPVLFDIVGGLNVSSINAELDLTTNLGGLGSFEESTTVVSPLLGGRFRWNATDNLAVVVAGSVSGFGISGLTQYGFRGGLDWMFSGNTSLGVGYRFSFLDYNSTSNDLNLDVDHNGPYLGVGFRF